MDNAGQYQKLCDTIASLGNVRAKEVNFFGSASPEGTYAGNKSLTESRAELITKIFRRDFPSVFGTGTSTQVHYATENWSEVLYYLNLYPIEGGEEVEALIRSYTGGNDNEHQSGLLKKQLKALNNGKTWALLINKVFPYTRRGSITMVFEPAPPVTPVPAVHDTVVVTEIVEPVPVVIPAPVTVHDTVYITQIVERPVVQKEPLDSSALAGMVRDILLSGGWVPASTMVSQVPADTDLTPTKAPKERKPIFALKTNLLSDLATALNAEIEFPIRNKVSLMLEHTFPWWLPSFEGKDYALELLRSGAEARYWFGDRSERPLLSGVFAGIYANADYFDLEWQNRGWQGETMMDFGLSFGYSFAIATNWRLETSIALGYINSPITEYDHRQDLHLLIYQKDDEVRYIGPTKLKCSLSWLLPNYPKNKGKK